MQRVAWSFLLLLVGFGVDVWLTPAVAAAPECGQAQVEKLIGGPPPAGPSAHYIVPASVPAPFYQWQSNSGYCGEVGLVVAGLARGQWLSQYNVRLVCGGFIGPEEDGHGPSLLQAGNPTGRRAHSNAQLLIESPGTGVTGRYDYDWAGRCGANAQLATSTYPYTTGYQAVNVGEAGYRDFMSWIKSQVIAGKIVTLGVLTNGDGDDSYDHEVTVIKIGTNHSPTDAAYYADDVLYFDDHGSFTVSRSQSGHWSFASNPSIPLGAGDDTKGCTPYVFAYRFDALARTRSAANKPGAPAYSIVLPSDNEILTVAGNDSPNGRGTVKVRGPHNYAFSVGGPIDAQGVTLPVTLAITDSKSQISGVWIQNPYDKNSSPAAGYNYETPYIGGTSGECDEEECVSNTQPEPMQLTFTVTVHGLKPGTTYNLYEYDLPTLTGADTGTAAALPVPTADFNANGRLATAVTRFKATAEHYSSHPVMRLSNQIVVFRAVPASAP